MAVIPLPVTKTKISTTMWGIPITNEVNALRTDVDALKAVTTNIPWTPLTLSNGWVNLGSPRGTTAYRVINGVGYLRVAMKSGTSGTECFIIPAAARPSYYVDAQVRCESAMGWLNFDASGSSVLFVGAGGASTFVGGLIAYPLT